MPRRASPPVQVAAVSARPRSRALAAPSEGGVASSRRRAYVRARRGQPRMRHASSRQRGKASLAATGTIAAADPPRLVWRPPLSSWAACHHHHHHHHSQSMWRRRASRPFSCSSCGAASARRIHGPSRRCRCSHCCQCCHCCPCCPCLAAHDQPRARPLLRRWPLERPAAPTRHRGSSRAREAWTRPQPVAAPRCPPRGSAAAGGRTARVSTRRRPRRRAIGTPRPAKRGLARPPRATPRTEIEVMHSAVGRAVLWSHQTSSSSTSQQSRAAAVTVAPATCQVRTSENE